MVQWAHQPWLRPYAAPPQADPRGPDGGDRSGGEAYLSLVLCWESGGGGLNKRGTVKEHKNITRLNIC